MDKLSSINQPFMISKFNPCGGEFDEPRPAVFWGQESEGGIRAMKYLDVEGGMELVNPSHAHKYEMISSH